MGTDGWRNWSAFHQGEPELENADDEVYSDRHFVGGPAELGPYRLAAIISSPPHPSAPAVRPSVKLTLGIHDQLIPDLVVDGKLAPANSDAYHGGGISDEVAALTSLHLGVRLRVAGTSRLSGFHDDDAPGRPDIFLEVPPLAHPGRLGREYVPAALTRPATLDKLGRIKTFPQVAGKDQVPLVRAARAYATGLWWSNEDPNLAWLQLVTAVEIAASKRKIHSSSEELIEELWPELWAALASADTGVRAQVTKVVAPQARATRKFIDFVTEYAPAPPESRPPYDVLDWDGMRGHAKLIYGHRSKALHDGKPFPLPMLEQPRQHDDGSLQETPGGMSTSGQGGIWNHDEAPMLLSTFEHIARGALLRWWDELVP